MNDSEFLTFVHQNADMGLSTLDRLNAMKLSSAMRKVIENQMLDYKSVTAQAESKLAAAGEAPKEINGFAKAGANAMITVKTMLDASDQHIAAMIMRGSTEGIIEISKKLKEADGVSEDVKNLGYKLLLTEEKNFNEMRHFL